MATAVLEAIGRNTVLAAAPAVKLAASSAGVLTAKRTGYTMSAAPEEIAGWRGRTLENDDGDTTVIYTNIADSVATKIGKIYGAASAPEDPAAHYDVTADDDVMVDMPTEHDIPWSKVKRADDLSATAGAGEDAKTTFAGSVQGIGGYVLLCRVRALPGAYRMKQLVRLLVPMTGRSHPPIQKARLMSRIQPTSPLAGG